MCLYTWRASRRVNFFLVPAKFGSSVGGFQYGALYCGRRGSISNPRVHGPWGIVTVVILVLVVILVALALVILVMVVVIIAVVFVIILVSATGG